MLTYTLHPCRSAFTRRGYELTILEDGKPYPRALKIEYPKGKRYCDPSFFIDNTPLRFYGNDGRTVRAEAVAHAKSLGAEPS